MWPLVAAYAASTAIQIASTSASAKNAGEQADNQLAAENYNNEMGYKTELNNIEMRSAVSKANLENLISATELSKSTNDIATEFNGSLIYDVAMYNDSLFENDIANVWTQAGLDIEILSNQRERERGSMVAAQGASGTIIGEGSNADAIVDQMTQEAMETFIVKTGAADKAATITNARMQSLYQARQEIAKLQFEGSMNNTVNAASASMKGQSLLTENYLQTTTDITNATTRIQTGMSDAANNRATNQLKIDNNFTTGMFGAANTAIKGVASAYSASQ